MPPSTSHDHVARARAGDTGALKLVIDAHGAAMYRVGFRLTRDHHAAEDVVQDALVRLLDDGTALPTANATRRWLLRVTRNLAISHVRRTSAAGRAVAHRAQLIDLTVESPARDVEARVLAAALLSELTDGERRMLIRHHVHGEALAVLAAEAATSTDVVKVQLSRARAKARATGRRRDIDGIPWWIPAPLFRLATITKTWAGSVGAKVALAALVPGLIIGGSSLESRFEPSPPLGQELIAQGFGDHVRSVASSLAGTESAPRSLEQDPVSSVTGPRSETRSPGNGLPAPSGQKLGGPGGVLDVGPDAPDTDVRAGENGPGVYHGPAKQTAEGEEYVVYGAILQEHGFYPSRIHQGDEGIDSAVPVVEAACVAAEHTPDEVAYCTTAEWP